MRDNYGPVLPVLLVFVVLIASLLGIAAIYVYLGGFLAGVVLGLELAIAVWVDQRGF